MIFHAKTYDRETDYEAVVSLKLKAQDHQEVEASSGVSAREVLEYIAGNDEVGEKFVLVYKGTIEGVLGCMEAPGVPDLGIVYFLSTDKIHEFKYRLTKYTQATLQMFLKKYKVLTNYTLADYTEAVDWLTKAGAVWDETEYILEDPDAVFKQFYFYRDKEEVCVNL